MEYGATWFLNTESDVILVYTQSKRMKRLSVVQCALERLNPELYGGKKP